VVEELLGKSRAVEEVTPEMKARTKLSLFKLSAWTSDLEAIPVARMLGVLEPSEGEDSRLPPARTVYASAPRNLRRGEVCIITLQYRVIICVVRVEEDDGAERSRRQSSAGRGPWGFAENGADG
jgi:hypothetical protein